MMKINCSLKDVQEAQIEQNINLLKIIFFMCYDDFTGLNILTTV